MCSRAISSVCRDECICMFNVNKTNTQYAHYVHTMICSMPDWTVRLSASNAVSLFKSIQQQCLLYANSSSLFNVCVCAWCNYTTTHYYLWYHDPDHIHTVSYSSGARSTSDPWKRFVIKGLTFTRADWRSSAGGHASPSETLCKCTVGRRF